MKSRFTFGFLMIIAVVIIIMTTHVGEVFSMAARPKRERVEEIKPDANKPSQPLEFLINEVLENNPELKFYEAEIERAKGLRKNAGLWSNPEVSGSIGQKRVTSSSDEGESETSKGIAHEIAVTQTLEWPGRIRLRKAIADRDTKVAELELEQFRAFLIGKTKASAYVFTASQEKAAATREVADHFHDLREVLIKRDQAGMTPLLEMRIIEAMEINIQRKASEAVLASNAAAFDLNQLRGAASNADIPLAKVNLKFRSLEEDRNNLIKLAGENDYQVRLRALELERQGFEVKLAKNQRFPAITAGPAISQERAGERERIIGAEISLPLPLWDRNQGNIKVEKAELTQAEVSFNLAQRDAERRAAEAIATYEAKLQEMTHWGPDSIQQFKEAAELADRHYRLGSVPVSTYVELQSQYLDLIEGLQETNKEALEAATRLELMTGSSLSLVTEKVEEAK